MAQQMYSVRKFATDSGFKDSDITYDPNRRMVQIQGKDFYGATPESDGSTYGTHNDLSSALNNYRNMQRGSQMDSLVNTMTQKVQNQQPFQYQAPKPFEFNPQADPRYQTAIQEANRNIGTAEGNIAAAQNKRGIMNSTMTANLGNQAAQREMGRVSYELLPQMYQQAYNQYSDQANRDFDVQKQNYNAQQDQFRNLGTVATALDNLNQQDFNNNRLTKQDHINLANQLSTEYGVPVNPTEDPMQSYAQVQGKQPLNAMAQAFNQLLQMSNLTGYLPDGRPIMQNDPNSLQGKGEIARSQYYLDHGNYYDNRAAGGGAPSVSQQRYNDQNAARGFEGQVTDELSQLKPEDQAGWLETNRGEITRQLGTEGFDRLKKSITADSQAQAKQTSVESSKTASQRRQAIALASKDLDWMDPTKREALIQEYMQYVQ